MPPTPVEIVTVEAAPVERTSDFVATVKSRRSATIQPQAEGHLTNIRVTSGQRVSPGDVMFEIDAQSQQAAVASLESLRAAREADAAFARQQLERARMLFEAGAMSKQEYEQAQAAQKAAEAQLKAVEEQIRQQRAELGYFRVTAPTAGVVGDVPVRVGDRVTRATELTTVSDNRTLEIYISVPVQQAPRLKLGLPVRVLDEDNQLITTTKIGFISPAVDEAMQSVLVKAPISQTAGDFRAEQFVRTEIVWSAEPAITVPVVAVTRINGQSFAYVAEPAEGGGLVARQRPLTLGPVVGDSYVVTSGLQAGDRLIVGGTQKIGNGAPVQPLPPGPPEGGSGAAPGGGQ